MRKVMIQMMKVGDPVTVDDSGIINGWLNAPLGRHSTTVSFTRRADHTKLLVPIELVQFRRVATSPVGPDFLVCEPCGHTWEEHDDDGCLWMVCACWLPGERK
jgi:hypothetical protein